MLFRLFTIFVSLTGALAVAPAAAAESIDAALKMLATASNYDEKEAAALAISASQHERVVPVLTALLEGQIYAVRDGGRIVVAESIEGGYHIRDVLSEEDLGDVGRRDVSRVTVNNSLRSSLRSLIASLRLGHADARERAAAVTEVGRSEDMSMVPILEAMYETEPSAKVRQAILTAVAMLNLDSSSASVRTAAIDGVSTLVDGLVRTKLLGIANNEEEQPAIRDAAAAALEKIADRAQLFDFVKTFFFGLSLGSILVLAAIGLSVTFGIMGVINMAHGELIMLGAYTTYVVQQLMPNAIGYSLLISVPAAFCVSGLMGIAIERGIVRFLYGRPLETLLATFGVSLVLQQAVRTIFSPLNRAVKNPEWMSGSWEIVQGLDITFSRLYIVVFSLFVFCALLAVLRRTRLGLEMRAVTQNRSMAKAMGVRSDRIDALTFGLGSGIAGVAGVALSQLTNVGPNLGQAYIVDSFMVVVFGGVGNIWGTMVSGLTLGVTNKLLEPAVGAVMAKIFVLIFLIIFIQKRPRGLFPQRGRAAES